MTHRPLGIGIIGAGNIVKRHALAYRSLPDLAKPIVVADIDARRAAEAKSQFGFQAAASDFEDVLARDDVDVVDICTPANHHARMAIKALQAGKHVLCEKPMATTLADADAIIRAAEERPNQTASFVFQLRAEASHRRMRHLIQGGHVGRPLTTYLSVMLRKKPAYYTAASGRGSWRCDGGGVLINQAVHQLDALISFLGEPTEVSAVMDTFVQPIEAEDTIAGWVKFTSGAFATVLCTVCAHSKRFLFEVLGQNAALSLGGDPDGHQFDWKVKAPGSAAQRALGTQSAKEVPAAPPDPASWRIAGQKLMSKLARRPWLPPTHWGHTPFIREFLTAAQSGSAGPVPPREARRSLELAMAFYESARTGKVVRLPLTEACSIYNGIAVDTRSMSKGDVQPSRAAGLSPRESADATPSEGPIASELAERSFGDRTTGRDA